MIGRLDRLASLFELKYDLMAEAIEPSGKEKILNNVATKIKDIYHSRVITKKDNILQFLANVGDRFSQHLIEDMTYLATDIDHLIKQPNQDQLLLEIANLRRDIADNKEPIRQALHNAVKINKESDKNYREHLKSKFEQTLWRIEQMLMEQGKVVMDFCSPEAVQLTQEIISGKTTPQRKELSKDKLLSFSRTPIAEKYGFDNLEILQKLLEDPEMKNKLTTVINSVNRGHIPRDGEAVLAEAKYISQQMQNKMPSPINELSEEEAQQAFKSKMDPAEHWSEEMNQRKKELKEEDADKPIDDPEKLEQQVKERDKTWEEKMLSKYNNLALIYKSLRREG